MNVRSSKCTALSQKVTTQLTKKYSYYMLIGVGVSCRFSYSIVSYLYVSCSGAIFPLSFTYNYMVSVRRGFFFLLVLAIGCVILLWYSMGLPYNHFKYHHHTQKVYTVPTLASIISNTENQYKSTALEWSVIGYSKVGRP